MNDDHAMAHFLATHRRIEPLDDCGCSLGVVYYIPLNFDQPPDLPASEEARSHTSVESAAS